MTEPKTIALPTKQGTVFRATVAKHEGVRIMVAGGPHIPYFVVFEGGSAFVSEDDIDPATVVIELES